MLNGPKLWDQLLEAVGVDGAVIAGGCIRDYMLGLEPKDYDIFVPCQTLKEWTDLKYAKFAGVSTLWELSDTQEGAEYNKSDFGETPLLGVMEGEMLGVRVNIIARTSHADGPEALIRSFDFHVLQAYYAGDMVEATPAMTRDIHQKRATLAHEKHKEQSIARFERFNARNPGVLRFRNPFGIDVC